MIEITGNLFNQQCDAICITTNGVVKKNGDAVMGAGVAKAAAKRWPWLPGHLGHLLRYGNITRCLYNPKFPAEENFNIVLSHAIVSLPTKNNWRDDSDINLIEDSLQRLVQICNNEGWKTVCLTRPGCGNGHLNWEKDVRPLCLKYLDDRFKVVTPGE